MKYPLDYLYQEWLDYDGSVLDTLRLSNDFAIDKQIEHLKSRAEKEREVRWLLQYYDRETINKVKELDLLTYLQNY